MAIIDTRPFSRDQATGAVKQWYHYDDETDEIIIEDVLDLETIGNYNRERAKENTGRFKDGMNWIGIAVDLARFRAPAAYRNAAEECLAELRACPPAPGFERVEVPGEREARMREERLSSGIPIPPETLDCLRALGRRLGLGAGCLLP